MLEPTPEARRRRKVVALTLAAVAIILFVITLIWWINLPDEDPGNPGIEDIGEEVSEVVR